MNIIVCVKQVIDPEAPPATFKLDPTTMKVVRGVGVALVVDSYGEYAVEAALRLKDKTPGSKITVISLGTDLSRDVVKKPLSMGADELILVEDKVFTDMDSWSTAKTLAMAIKKIGNYDLVFCGRESSDTNAGQVGPGIAEVLDLPSVTLVKSIEVNGKTAVVERLTGNGYDIIEVKLPAVITMSNEVGEPRYPSIKGIMAAKKKEPVVWRASDIGVEGTKTTELVTRTKILRLYQPTYERRVSIIGADTPEEAGAKLAVRLRQEKLL